MRPFWFEIRVEDFIWKYEIDLGRMFSSQMESRSIDADFWLMVKLVLGVRRCIMVG